MKILPCVDVPYQIQVGSLMSQCYEMCSCSCFIVGTFYVARYDMETIFKFRLCSTEYY